MNGVHRPFPDDGVLYCGWDGYQGCGEHWPCATERARLAAEGALIRDDFPFTFRWDLVRAYPVISGVPDARVARADEINAGFDRILFSANLRPVLDQYLAKQKARR